jgi:hypothetical protein
MSQIVNLVLHALKDHLTEEMQTNIDSFDKTQAAKVKIGRLQESPVPLGVYLAISGGDPQNPDLQDGILDVRASSPGWNTGFEMATYEVGGDPTHPFLSNSMWWRRGIVELGCFWMMDQLDEESAAESSYEVLGRLIFSIESCDVRGLKDTYGERAVKIFPFSNRFFESGGPPKQYIWRGSVQWQCLTERSRP